MNITDEYKNNDKKLIENILKVQTHKQEFQNTNVAFIFPNQSQGKKL